jgi:hypothetical protein
MNKKLQIILIIIAFPVSVCARISGMPTCNDLFKRADVVVKGKVLSVKDNGLLKLSPIKPSHIETQAQRLGANEQEAKFRVDRVISGNVSEKTLSIYFYQVVSKMQIDSLISLNPHEYVILFLKKSSKGYTLVDLDHGKLSASLKKGRNPNARNKDGLSDELASLLEESDPNLVAEGIKCLGEIGGAHKYLPKLKQLKDSENPGVRWKRLVWLARSGDDSAAKDMIAIFSSSKTLSAEMFLDFEDAIGSFNEQRSHDLAPNIIPLLKHSKMGIRRVAVRFFRNLKDKEFIPQVLPLLDDNDRFIQYDALMMICETVRPNRTGCPSTILFYPNPEKYISEWKNWWRENSTDFK